MENEDKKAQKVELPADRKLLLSTKDIQALTGLSLVTLMRFGNFPKPLNRFSTRKVWRRIDLDEWIKNLR